ncbi:MAG: patatin-like phospholipase family protein [Hyphomicrobiaceae bacterium]
MARAGDYKIGLALGGGAARGWAHIGVIKALAEAGIVPDVVAGTSIGAVVGGCYVIDRLDVLEQFALSLTRRKVLGFLDFNLAGTGLISGQRLCDLLGSHLGELRIEDLPKPFTAVATEIGSGHEVWLSRGSLVDAMRASYALPGIFRPVRIKGRWLFDGALVNPVPVSVCRALGARYVIAVNLNSDMCARGTVLPDITAYEGEDDKPAAEPVKGKNGVAVRALLHRQLFGGGDNTPGISTVVVDALNIVQDRIARSRLAGDPPDAIINPRLAGIGPFDFHRAGDLIELGKAAVRREIEDLADQLMVRGRLEPAPASEKSIA